MGVGSIGCMGVGLGWWVHAWGGEHWVHGGGAGMVGAWGWGRDGGCMGVGLGWWVHGGGAWGWGWDGGCMGVGLGWWVHGGGALGVMLLLKWQQVM